MKDGRFEIERFGGRGQSFLRSTTLHERAVAYRESLFAELIADDCNRSSKRRWTVEACYCGRFHVVCQEKYLTL